MQNKLIQIDPIALGRWWPLDQCFALCVKISYFATISYHMQLCGFYCIIWYSICIQVISQYNFINFSKFHVVHGVFLYPTSTKCAQMTIWLVHSIINSLYTKHSVHLWVFFTFLVILVNFINFGLNGNDMCQSHQKHAFYHHNYLALCTIYHFSSVEAISPLKVLSNIY